MLRSDTGSPEKYSAPPSLLVDLCTNIEPTDSNQIHDVRKAAGPSVSPVAGQSSRRQFDEIELPARLFLSLSLLESCSGLNSAAVFAVGHSRNHVPFHGALLSRSRNILIDAHGYS
jgi:hypothetical protein